LNRQQPNYKHPWKWEPGVLSTSGPGADASQKWSLLVLFQGKYPLGKVAPKQHDNWSSFFKKEGTDFEMSELADFHGALLFALVHSSAHLSLETFGTCCGLGSFAGAEHRRVLRLGRWASALSLWSREVGIRRVQEKVF
jgi:hypothetical protein